MKPHAKVETLTIRVSPKIKYGLELLARKQHRTLSSVADWALSKALKEPGEGLEDGLLEEVWDPLEPDRLVKLALKCPELLTYEEQLLWKVIKDNSYFWLSPTEVHLGFVKMKWSLIKAALVDNVPFDVLLERHEKGE